MKILNFSGTATASIDTIQQVLAIIERRKQAGETFSVTVAAFENVTNLLLRISSMAGDGNADYKESLNQLKDLHLDRIRGILPVKNQSRVLANTMMLFNDLEDVLHGVFLIRELTPKSRDLVLSFGERLAAYIVSEAAKLRFPAEYVDARELILTDMTFGRAQINQSETLQRIHARFKKPDMVYILPGFIGATRNNETTTLGRGGSELTAAMVAAALNADEIEIWTDINGVYTADPRKVATAMPIAHMSYIEAMELAHFGTHVLYPPAIQPARENSIPIRIRNIAQPEAPGTIIGPPNETDSTALITGMSAIDGIAILQVQGSGMIGVTGIAGRIFSRMAQATINVILISQASSEHSICFAVNQSDANTARQVLITEFVQEINAHQIDDIVIEADLSIIAVVGEKMRRTPGIAGKIFTALGENKVNVVACAQGASELNVSFVVKEKESKRALAAIHREFFGK